jgi:plasmid stabilization system protein ParE
MSYNFVNKPAVVYDIEDVVDYYNKINPNLAISFIDRLEEAKAYIVKHPKAFQIKYKNVKTILLK